MFSVWCDISSAESWQEAFQCLVPFFKKHYTRIVLDDLEHSKSESEVIAAIEQLSKSLADMKNLFLLPCRCEASFGKHELFRVPLYTASDIKKHAQKMSAVDVARLCAVTGGLSALLNDYDENNPFSDNFYAWTSTDSMLYRLMPQMLSEQFRTPESYHAILYAIATGKHRLSEIAKHMAVPNNQCKKYLDALIAMGLVAVKEHHYSILNSYVDFWHRFFYLKTSRLVTAPHDIANEIQSQFDEAALEKQLPECIKKLPFDIPKDAKRQYNAVFDFVFQSGSHTVLIKLPESLDWHCTKQELDTLLNSVTDYCGAFYEAEIYVVSFNRFSNYCVRQASGLDNLHLVAG
jgi:AAA+ ATPase superfamily predicted ATPase